MTLSCQEDSIPLHSTPSPMPLFSLCPLSTVLSESWGKEGTWRLHLRLRFWQSLVLKTLAGYMSLQWWLPSGQSLLTSSSTWRDLSHCGTPMCTLRLLSLALFVHLHLLCIGAEKTSSQAGAAWPQRLRLSSSTAPTGQMPSIIMGLNDQLCHRPTAWSLGSYY